MMEEIRFRHDSREYQTLFQPTCTLLYYVYIYTIFFVVWIFMTKKDG